MMGIVRAVLFFWFVGLPTIALFTLGFLVVVGVLGLPLWLALWWLST